MKLGVFDSGIGGEAVAETLRRAFPDAEVITANDRAHLPYGQRPTEELIRLTDTAIQPLLAHGCDIIILACNTATAAAIETLRRSYPHQKFIGLEAMIKTASLQTKTGIICVCATPATLNSERYKKLKATYASDVKIIEPDCSHWAEMIEDNMINHATIVASLDTACERGTDVIVLACTHYHWIRKEIERAVSGRAIVIDPSEAIVRRVRQLLELG